MSPLHSKPSEGTGQAATQRQHPQHQEQQEQDKEKKEQ
jgi:hypothetical protein